MLAITIGNSYISISYETSQVFKIMNHFRLLRRDRNGQLLQYAQVSYRP
jgi:hypothetical protein